MPGGQRAREMARSADMKKLRVGVLGLHHDHIWGNLEELTRLGPDRVELAGAADPHPELREKYAALHGGPVFDDYEALLADESLDAVYIFASNLGGEDLTVAACGRGLHCLVEKPMAATLAGAERMLEAAERAGVRLMINWPFLWWPQMQQALKVAAAGEIGALWQVKYRSAHEGPKELGCSQPFCEWLYDETLNGAGALMDYCCYGAVLARTLLGRPHSVSGMTIRTGLKADLVAEDNAVIVMSYPHSLAITEGSWTQIGNFTAYTALIHGSTGTLLVEPDHGGRLLKATLGDRDGIALPVPAIPSGWESASAHFLHVIEHPDAEIHPMCDARHGRDAQEILEAGLNSARQGGAAVALPVSAS